MLQSLCLGTDGLLCDVVEEFLKFLGEISVCFQANLYAGIYQGLLAVSKQFSISWKTVNVRNRSFTIIFAAMPAYAFLGMHLLTKFVFVKQMNYSSKYKNFLASV